MVGIWFAQLPGDRIIVWSPNRNSAVTKGAILELDFTGNLILSDQTTIIWSSNTSNHGIETALMSESGNLLLLGSVATSSHTPIWDSFSQPSDTLLPNQPLSVSLELTSSPSPSRNGHYSLKMLQQHTSLALGLTYSINNPHANYSYWSGPEISNVTGNVTAVLDDSGSFKIVYGESSAGAVYVYKSETEDNRNYNNTTNNPRFSSKPVLRRLVLESNGNLRLYRWDNDVNGSRLWVAEWAAVSNPCDVAGICANGVCNLDRSKKNADCVCLPGSVELPDQANSTLCSDNSSLVQECENSSRNDTFKISTIQETNYYFSERSVVANYSDMDNASRCGEMCMSDCKCVASVYGLDNEKPYCWILKGLDFGGFKDPGSTLFVKTRANGSNSYHNYSKSDGNKGVEEKVLVIPIVVFMVVLVGLLGCLLYYNLDKRRMIKRSTNPLILRDSPVNFTYRDLHICTNGFSQLLGTGGFGSVYKGSLTGGTLVAVKKLERVLSHGEREFITEVNTIGSMHHMNLVRLCGYCSEDSHRLLVYEFMKNGSLDKWIFPTSMSRTRLLDWKTRFNIAIATAQGISYFHEQCRNKIIHCDIKPENILLDENFCPKISDFGLAKLMGREHSHVMTMVRGTRGYLAPEWVSNRPITVKADVYSYGMLLLELVGGRRNLDMSFGSEDFFYPGLAFKEMSNATVMKSIDKRLHGIADEEEVTKALKVAFWCIQDDIGMRPSMGEVVKLLEGSADEINIPPMPQTVLELIEEGLEHVYMAMKREFNNELMSSFMVRTTTSASYPSFSRSHATCSYSSMSPR